MTGHRKLEFVRRFLGDISGNYIMSTALALPIIIGCFGYMSEYMTWYSGRQAQQNAADSAAMSAVIGLIRGETNYVAQARAVTGSHGYVHGVKTAMVEVNRPPLSGAFAGKNNAVEVILNSDHPATFSKVLGRESQKVTARSVATLPYFGCVLALNPSAAQGIRAQGHLTVNAPTCSMIANSTDAKAMVAGGNTSFTVGSVNLSGGLVTHGKMQVQGPVYQYVEPTPDPYANLAIPAPSGACRDFAAAGPNPGPDTYCSMTIKSAITLQPGTYVIDGDLSMHHGGTLTGRGVTLVLTKNSKVQMSGGTMNLTAPTAGTYAGMVMLGARDMKAGTNFNFTGQAEMKIMGAIYMPRVDVMIRARTETNGCMQIVADRVQFGGDTTFETNCSMYGLPWIGKKVALVE